MSAAKNAPVKWARHARTLAMKRARKEGISAALRHVHVQDARVANRRLVSALILSRVAAEINSEFDGTLIQSERPR